MKILVTGAKGFIGRNLIAELENRGYAEIMRYDCDTGSQILEEYAAECDFVYHLAGVNRPVEEKDFDQGNTGFTRELLELLQQHGNAASVLMTSSIQAVRDNPYGRSKLAAEELVLAHGDKTGAQVMLYRLCNVFGKWSKPNYNSVVATFCHNAARGLPLHVDNPDAELMLSYIDDVVEEFLRAMEGKATRAVLGCGEHIKECGTNTASCSYCMVPTAYLTTPGRLADIIGSFQYSRVRLSVADMADNLTKKLYSTYLSFLPEDSFAYPLTMHCDNRGSFTEFLRLSGQGQVSVNIIKPGIIKGNHWHNSKNEKFMVVSGEASIRFRRHDSSGIIEYKVSGEKLMVVDIPVGYAHSIENIGSGELVTIMWANECFDPQKPDTYFQEVSQRA